MKNYGIRTFIAEDKPQIARNLDVSPEDVILLKNGFIAIHEHDDELRQTTDGYGLYRMEHAGEDGWVWVGYGGYDTRKELNEAVDMESETKEYPCDRPSQRDEDEYQSYLAHMRMHKE